LSLEKIKGSYDAVFSLGNVCLGAIQLKKFNLRPFAGVLDWVSSYSLPDVKRLLQNRFSGFMELPNLKVLGYATDLDLLVLDEAYSIYFNHDFKTDKNTVSHLAAYTEVKEKYNRRVGRFLEKLDTSQRILFIRTEGTLEEVKELESILSGMVKNDFRLLVVNHTKVNGMIEKNWDLEKVSVVELPDDEKWDANDHYWESIFNGVHLIV
jgi:hypothetical protein